MNFLGFHDESAHRIFRHFQKIIDSYFREKENSEERLRCTVQFCDGSYLKWNPHDKDTCSLCRAFSQVLSKGTAMMLKSVVLKDDRRCASSDVTVLKQGDLSYMQALRILSVFRYASYFYNIEDEGKKKEKKMPTKREFDDAIGFLRLEQMLQMYNATHFLRDDFYTDLPVRCGNYFPFLSQANIFFRFLMDVFACLNNERLDDKIFQAQFFNFRFTHHTLESYALVCFHLCGFFCFNPAGNIWAGWGKNLIIDTLVSRYHLPPANPADGTWDTDRFNQAVLGEEKKAKIPHKKL